MTDGGGSTVSVLDINRNVLAGAITVGDKPVAVAVVPNQGPTASFWVSPTQRRAKKRLTFHASGSTDSDGKITSYSWDFGDRGKAEGPQPTRAHSYRRRGTYFVTLKVTDNEGCSTETVFTGQTVSCHGQPAGVDHGADQSPRTNRPEAPGLRLATSRGCGGSSSAPAARRSPARCGPGGIVATSDEESGRKVRHLRRLGDDSAPAADPRLAAAGPAGARLDPVRGRKRGARSAARPRPASPSTPATATNEVTVETKVVKLGF